MINSTCYNQTWVKLSLWKRLVCGYSFDQIQYFLNQGWFVSSDFFVTECTLFHTPENVLCLPSCWYWPSGSGDFECRQCSFLTIRYYLPLKKDLLFYLKKNWIPLTQWYFLLIKVEIGVCIVFLEKKTNIKQTHRRADEQTNRPMRNIS